MHAHPHTYANIETCDYILCAIMWARLTNANLNCYNIQHM